MEKVNLTFKKISNYKKELEIITESRRFDNKPKKRTQRFNKLNSP